MALRAAASASSYRYCRRGHIGEEDVRLAVGRVQLHRASERGHTFIEVLAATRGDVPRHEQAAQPHVSQRIVRIDRDRLAKILIGFIRALRAEKLETPVSPSWHNTHRPRAVSSPDARSARARSADSWMRSSSVRLVTMRSCKVKMSSRRPSIFSAACTALFSTSAKCGVSRTRSPAFWNPPQTTQRAPNARPNSIARSASRAPPIVATRPVAAVSVRRIRPP